MSIDSVCRIVSTKLSHFLEERCGILLGEAEWLAAEIAPELTRLVWLKAIGSIQERMGGLIESLSAPIIVVKDDLVKVDIPAPKLSPDAQEAMRKADSARADTIADASKTRLGSSLDDREEFNRRLAKAMDEAHKAWEEMTPEERELEEIRRIHQEQKTTKYLMDEQARSYEFHRHKRYR